MSDGAQLIVWLIDEDERQLRVHQRYLQKALVAEGAEITVQMLPARPHIDNYYDILQDPQTVGIVVDQRLNEAQGIDHTGISLAIYLRNLMPRLPIYILTNYPQSDDLVGGEWSVEDIIAKDDMHDAGKRKTFANRLLRHINVQQEILEARAARFHDLLTKSLDHSLTKKEQKEFDALRVDRVAVVVASEADKLRRLEEALAKLKRLRASSGD